MLHRGVACESAQLLALETRVSAAGLAIGAPVIACLHTAAEFHGFGVVTTDRVHVIDPAPRHLAARDWLVLHQLFARPDEVISVDGLLATTPARTAIEVARNVGRPRALAVLDAALRRQVAMEELAEQCERQAGRRGIVEVRTLLPLADGRAESPMESVTRLICLQAGLPAPELQFVICDESGWPARYLDLAWPDHKVAVEYDGVAAHTGAEALRRDRARHNFLVERGWTIIYATADDVLRHPGRLIARISRALARATAAQPEVP
jgi:AbiEi antitoxin C-terminal domain/Protein of unknown function (DUF559)